MVNRSQCDCVGGRQARTWEEYKKGCLMTFAGGHEGETLSAFRHGMETVFRLLEEEFPPAEVIREWEKQHSDPIENHD